MIENTKSNNSSIISSSDEDSNLGIRPIEKNIHMDKVDLTYLDIFSRPSYRDSKKRKFNDGEGITLDYKKSEDFTENYSQNDNDKNSKSKQKIETYDYPTNIFGTLFFSWTRKVIRAANNFSQLEISHLGKFSPDYYPSSFLKDIKPN